MPERTPLVAGNWKMHKTREEAAALMGELVPAAGRLARVEIVVCPPFTALDAVARSAGEGPVRVAAQNMHAAPAGAFTGEVAASMLAEIGAWGVILGHSERRQLFGETDAALAEKVPAAFEAGLVPILCVGETEAQRDAGEMRGVLARQVEAGLALLDASRLGDLVVAYEPIWAIGTGRTASPQQAQEAIAFVRELLSGLDAGAAASTRILYGGSVKPGNAAELLREPDVDGALVGGASLNAADFLAICAAAGESGPSE